jgi:RHS repeat-associated protein
MSGRQNQGTEYAGSTLVVARQTTERFDPITGGITQVVSNEGVVNHAYDPRTGRLTRTWTGTSPGTLTEDTSYGYDALGRLASVSVATLDGATFSSAEVTRYGYDGAGDLASVTTPGGVKTSYFYDGLNRLTTETTDRVSGSTVNHVAEYDYALRADGLRTGVVEKTWNAAATAFSTVAIGWGYDNLNRLTSETRQNQTPGLSTPDVNDCAATYQFDLAGNRAQYTITKPNVTGQNETQTSAYNGDDQLTLANSTLSGLTSYLYDLNGSLTTQTHTPLSGASDTQTYTWDLRNRMATAVIGNATTTFGYDSSGFRVSETTATTTSGQTTTVARTFLPDTVNPSSNVQALEERVNGALDRAYILGLRVEAQKDGQGMAYLLRDGHGSTRELLDDQGGVITDSNGNPLLYSYDAYGSHLGFNAGTARTTQLFGGDGEFDVPTGLTYHDARFRQGCRFISMDSYGGQTSDPMSLHKYVYAGDNPVMYVDANGHEFSYWALLAVAAIGGVIGGLSTVTANYALNRPLSTNLGTGVGFGLVAAPASVLIPAVGVALAGLGLMGSATIVYQVHIDPKATTGQSVAAYSLLAASALGGFFAVRNYNQVPTWINPKGFSVPPLVTPFAQTARANFAAQVAAATDGVLGGFVKADGTVDFVPFTRSGYTGHVAARAAGAIPKDAIGGFSLGVKGGQVVDFNFNSILNGDKVSLSPELQQQIIDALPKATDISIETDNQ